MPIQTEGPVTNGQIFDTLLQLKDAGLVASSAAAEVGGSAKILDLGAGKAEGNVILDVTAVEVASGDEIYTVVCEFSNSASFASGIIAGVSQQLGHATPIIGGADTNNGVGRYVVPYTNVVNGTHYQYMRLYTVVAGTIATGVNYSAFIAKR